MQNRSVSWPSWTDPLSIILFYNLESISEISVWHTKNTISLRTSTLSLDMSQKFCLKQNEPYCYTFTLFHLIFMYLILVLLCTVLVVYWNYHKAIRNWYVEGKIDIQVDFPNEKRSTVDLTSKKNLLNLITPTGWHPYMKEFAPTPNWTVETKLILSMLFRSTRPRRMSRFWHSLNKQWWPTSQMYCPKDSSLISEGFSNTLMNSFHIGQKACPNSKIKEVNGNRSLTVKTMVPPI